MLNDDGYFFYAAVAAGVLGGQSPLPDLEAGYSYAADSYGPNVEGKTISKIEDFWRSACGMNELSINVVYCDERQQVIPVRAGTTPFAKQQVVLMLLHASDWVLDTSLKMESDSIFMTYYIVSVPNHLCARRHITHIN